MPLDQQARELPAPLPANLEVEWGILGGLFFNNRAHNLIAGTVRPEHFSDETNAAIFAAIDRELSAGRICTTVTLKNEFPTPYLAQLAGVPVLASQIPDYAQTLVDLWRRRELIKAAQGVAEDARASFDQPASSIIEALDKRLSEITASEDERAIMPLSDTLEPTLQRVEAAWKSKGRLMGVTTGLADLDKLIGGLHAGRLYILAGRPGMGKTSCAKTVALAAARACNTVAYFSLEMPAEELTQWLLADLTGISASRQMRGEIDENDIQRLATAADDLRSLPLLIDDSPGLGLAQLRARLRRLKRREGLGLVIVDHIGWLRASRRAREQNRVAEVTEISNTLKALAKELNAPVLALSQLSRAVEGRDDKRPALSDLRDSGSIEQDADAVIFCYRQEYYERKREPERKSGEKEPAYQARLADWNETLDRCRGIAELIVAKQRSGPEGTVRVRFEPEHSRMANLWWGK